MNELLSEAEKARAESAGLKIDKVSELLARVQKEVKEGLLPSAQVAVARNGKVGVFESYGSAKPESLTCIFVAKSIEPRKRNFNTGAGMYRYVFLSFSKAVQCRV